MDVTPTSTSSGASSGTVQLFSGGLDSLALWHLCGRPQPVYVRVGAPYEEHELDTLELLARNVPGFTPRVVDGPRIAASPHPDGHIDHRNLVLLATAASYTGASRLLLGALLGEASPDKSRAFLRATSRALTASERRPVRVVAPARRWTKTGLLRRFLAAHPDAAWQLAYTRSCYAPGGPCGTCQACFRRAVALYRAGLAPERPRLPARAGSPWAALRTAGPARWPALAVNNGGAALALAGIRPAPPAPPSTRRTTP